MWDFIYLQLKKTSLYINRDECIGFAYRSASPWRYFIQKRLIEIQCDKVVLTAIVVLVILFTYYYFCNGEVFVKMIFLIQEHWEVSVRARSSYRQESDPNRWRTRGFAHSQVLSQLLCCLSWSSPLSGSGADFAPGMSLSVATLQSRALRWGTEAVLSFISALNCQLLSLHTVFSLGDTRISSH